MGWSRGSPLESPGGQRRVSGVGSGSVWTARWVTKGKLRHADRTMQAAALRAEVQKAVSKLNFVFEDTFFFFPTPGDLPIVFIRF